MDWLPVIIICAMVGSIFVFFIFPLMMFACFKSSQRRVEKVERREMLAQSLRASRESLASTRRAMRASRESLDSLGGAGIDTSKRRRPPLGTGTFDEDTTFSDSADKSKYDYFRHMSPQTSVDYASTKWDDDSTFYDDSEMGGALCENEIATMPAESRFRPPARPAAYPPASHERVGAGGYQDDDASVTQSLMGSNFRRHQRPRPAPSYDSPSGGGLGAVDETESMVGGSRPTSDTSSVVTSEGRTRPPRPRLRWPPVTRILSNPQCWWNCSSWNRITLKQHDSLPYLRLALT